jgi:hypothetical protein
MAEGGGLWPLQGGSAVGRDLRSGGRNTSTQEIPLPLPVLGLSRVGLPGPLESCS